MWPQALQMTRDECRGVLRRLELESYSHVISVFRAQGGLSDTKTKLLEELRGIFHISQERHRAEARRVANDEQLSTIAEAISGPNTWQEWSREGRRSFPMLPRVAPQTALALIANNLASETAAENAKLPYPSETAAAVAEDHTVYATARDAAAWDADRGGYVVTSDPFKMPDIPAAAAAKKNLKRNMPDGQSGSNKKRITSEMSPTKQQQQHQQQKQYQHITASSNVSPNVSNIKKLYHNHTKLQQQRFFHQQQQLQKQKVASKKSAAASVACTTAPAKRQTTPAKCGRRAQKHQLQQQLQQQQQAEQTQLQQQLRNVSYVGSNNSELPQIDLQEEPSQSFALGKPQIAASKKDITKNLTKLQIQATAAVVPNIATRISTLEQHVAATSPLMAGTASSPLIIGNKTEKQLISTPVQKYIVEDRQPPLPTSAPQIMTLPQLSAAANKLRAVNTTILPPGTKLTAKKLPGSTVVTATPTGASPTTTTLLDHASGAGTSSSIASSQSSNSSQPQVFNIIEGTTITTSAGGLVSSSAPTHTVPAIIQLHSTSNSDPTSSQQPTQSKVLTTKLLPLVLSGAGASATNINKIETLNNGATIIAAGSGISSASGATVGTIIKSLPSTMLLTNQSGTTVGNNSAGGTIISTLGPGATVFRKPPNIIKTNIIGVGSGTVLGGSTTKIASAFNSSNSSGGPQIISNIKLTPAIVNTTTTTGGIMTSSQQQQQQYLQQQLKNVSATGIRTSVKICQSPNGKVFIQPANVDAAKAKLQGGLQHKLLSNALVGATGAGSGGVGATTPTTARVAIQKVQIIPAPMSSPGGLTGSLQPQKTTLTIAGSKSNMIFMPATATRSATGTITLAKGNIVAKAPQPQSADLVKSNVVVVGATTLPQTSQALAYNSATFIDNNSKTISTLTTTPVPATGNVGGGGNHTPLKNSQMITEDTPVDILNMPIIVDNNGSVTSTNAVGGSNIGDTVTVLSADNFIDACSQLDAQQSPQPQVILGATDWEMELDQATAVAAARKARTQRRRISSNSGRQRKSYSEQLKQQQKAQVEAATILIDDCFEDVIVEEQEEGEQEEEQEQELDQETTHYDVHEQDQDGLLSVNNDIIVLDDEKTKVEELPSQTSQHKRREDVVPIQLMQEREERQTKVAATGSREPQTIIVPASECETDAGFDETIVTELDENTAIEYIEEDHSVSAADCQDMKLARNANKTTAATIVLSDNAENSAARKMTATTKELSANSFLNVVNDLAHTEKQTFLFAAIDETSMDSNSLIESDAICSAAIDGNSSQDEQ